MRKHYKSEHWAPCRNQTPSWYDWKIVESTVKPEQTTATGFFPLPWRRGLHAPKNLEKTQERDEVVSFLSFPLERKPASGLFYFFFFHFITFPQVSYERLDKQRSNQRPLVGNKNIITAPGPLQPPLHKTCINVWIGINTVSLMDSLFGLPVMLLTSSWDLCSCFPAQSKAASVFPSFHRL